MMEGVLAGVIPIVPDRCSYKEMYLPEFKYPSEWTESPESYLKHRDEMIAFINERIVNRCKYMDALKKQKEILIRDYLQPTVMVNCLLENVW